MALIVVGELLAKEEVAQVAAAARATGHARRHKAVWGGAGTRERMAHALEAVENRVRVRAGARVRVGRRGRVGSRDLDSLEAVRGIEHHLDCAAVATVEGGPAAPMVMMICEGR